MEPSLLPSTRGQFPISPPTSQELVCARSTVSTNARATPTACGTRWPSTSLKAHPSGETPGPQLVPVLMLWHPQTVQLYRLHPAQARPHRPVHLRALALRPQPVHLRAPALRLQQVPAHPQQSHLLPKYGNGNTLCLLYAAYGEVLPQRSCKGYSLDKHIACCK